MSNDAGKEELVSAWEAAYKNATECDRWGQPVEAIGAYRSLSNSIEDHTRTEAHTFFTENQKKTLKKISVCLEIRCRQLEKHRNCWDGISLDDLKKIEKTLKTLLHSKSSKDFPIKSLPAQELCQLPVHSKEEPNDPDVLDTEKAINVKGTLLPGPAHIPGQTHVSFHIEKIGLKEASQYIDPHITVSVRDSQGANATVVQDTPLASYKTDSYVMFGIDVHIQRPVEVLPEGFAVFFEFKHYKPKKKFVSTKCWACMEKDEIKEGTAVLELYKKPADYRRKGVHLLTIKPLYLHLKMTLS